MNLFLHHLQIRKPNHLKASGLHKTTSHIKEIGEISTTKSFFTFFNEKLRGFNKIYFNMNSNKAVQCPDIVGTRKEQKL